MIAFVCIGLLVSYTIIDRMLFLNWLENLYTVHYDHMIYKRTVKYLRSIISSYHGKIIWLIKINVINYPSELKEGSKDIILESFFIYKRKGERAC